MPIMCATIRQKSECMSPMAETRTVLLQSSMPRAANASMTSPRSTPIQNRFRLRSKPMIYANIATKAKVVVIDRNTHKVTDWPLKSGKANYPMALDEADHRLFVVTRKPAQLVVLDTDSGGMVASVPCVSDSDDAYYDAARKRIYVPGGEGFISVVQQI